MPEIRLAVCHPNEAGTAGIAARLRGAIVQFCGDLFLGPPTGCDAFLMTGLVDVADIERILLQRAHVLLIADPCPHADAITALDRAAGQAGVRLAVVNPDRYLPSRQLIRRQLPVPLGEPGLIRLHRWEPAAVPDALVRDLDVMLWLVGRQPDRVFAVERKPQAASRYLQLHLGFPGGGMALLDYTNHLPAGDGYHSLTVIAASGAAYADDHGNRQLLYRGGHPQAVRTEERAGQLAAIAQDFVDALREGRDPGGSAADWQSAFAVADAVERSLATGLAVTLEER